MIKEYYIKNFKEYILKVKELKDKNENREHRLWFRGQSNSDWGLLPGIFRETYSVTTNRGE